MMFVVPGSRVACEVLVGKGGADVEMADVDGLTGLYIHEVVNY